MSEEDEEDDQLLSYCTPQEIASLTVIKAGTCTVDAHSQQKKRGKPPRNWVARAKFGVEQRRDLMSTPFEYHDPDRGFLPRRCTDGSCTQLVRVATKPKEKGAKGKKVRYLTNENKGRALSLVFLTVDRPFKTALGVRWAVMSDGSLVIWFGTELTRISPPTSSSSQAEDSDSCPPATRGKVRKKST